MLGKIIIKLGRFYITWSLSPRSKSVLIHSLIALIGSASKPLIVFVLTLGLIGPVLGFFAASSITLSMCLSASALSSNHCQESTCWVIYKLAVSNQIGIFNNVMQQIYDYLPSPYITWYCPLIPPTTSNLVVIININAKEVILVRHGFWAMVSPFLVEFEQWR